MERIIVTGGSGFIGTNLVEHLVSAGDAVYNVDLQSPKTTPVGSVWVPCDILDSANLKRAFYDIAPTQVVHLAARTDTDGSTLGDYSTNTAGTENVMAALKVTPTVGRAIFTSSQFVVGPGEWPQSDDDFRPHTVYGQSKAIAERLVRGGGLNCAWTIVRPTNIWGPWHPRYPSEFWRVLKQGRYLHPGRRKVDRCYGYVGNVAFQLGRILALESAIVDQKVFYLGDRPIELFEWVNAFSKSLVGRDARVVPRSMMRALAAFGDLATLLGIKFPLTTSRYRSMTMNYLTPMEATFVALGESPYSLQDGVDATVRWLRSQNGFWQ